jgi:hypothetical protein
MRCVSEFLKASMVIERTKEMCTPSPRCVPAQFRQMNVPNFGDAWHEKSVRLGKIRSQDRQTRSTYPLRRGGTAVATPVIAVDSGVLKEL